ncbi:hypothetical protein PR048_028283 [Dryococelus australis]|uniref:Uncharacterized protein n=1 Tax=Dryococelus australis TaxID=614101 RepID=A0ABQ9GIV2_9NEOP|nr:hypothetical protein PR048_028283 [Dryococelus australis]
MTSQLLYTGSEDEIDLITIKTNQEILHGKISEFSTLHECVFDLMLAAGVHENELGGELSGSDVYKTRYATLCIKISHIVYCEETPGVFSFITGCKRSGGCLIRNHGDMLQEQ